MSALTKKQFVNAFRAADEVVIRWNSSPGPRIAWNGRDSKSISEAVVEAVHKLQDLAATSDVADDAKKLILALDRFSELFFEWANDSSIAPDETNPAGSDRMWKQWDSVRILIAQPARSKPERIEALVQQNVSDRQIALIYGWKTENGNPDIDRVQREKEQPGSEYKPDQWVHPIDVRELAEVNAVWQNRNPIAHASADKSVKPMAPETLDELLQQNVSSRQIMRMKPGTSYEEIRSLALAKGYPLDGVRYSPDDKPAGAVDPNASQNPPSPGHSPINGESAPTDPAFPPALYDNDPEKLAYLKASILELSEKGQTNEQIVAAMVEDFPTLEVSQVAVVVNSSSQLAGL